MFFCGFTGKIVLLLKNRQRNKAPERMKYMKNDYLSDQIALETEQEQNFLKESGLFTSQITHILQQPDVGRYRELISSSFRETLMPYIGENFDMLKLYVAVHVADCARSGNFNGIPSHITENLKKQAFVQITKARDQKDLYELTNALLEHLADAYQKYAANAYSPAVQRAVEYIHSQLYQPLSASDVANHLHMERTNLSKRFHRETGMTITDYIHTIKTDQAEELIHYRHYSLLEISDLLGYSSYSYFCKVYRKYKHCAPSDPY